MLQGLTLESLDQTLFKFYEKNLEKVCKDRRSKILDNSNLQGYEMFEPNGLKFPSLKINEKILLGVLLWYMPDELRVLCHLWLEEHWGGEFKEVRAVLLTSKRSALGYLLVNDRWSARDFFGNVLTKKSCETIMSFKLRKRSTKRPKQKVWRRGYQDHGTLRPKHSVPKYDYRKFKTYDQKLQEEELLRQKIISLENLVNDRLMQEINGFSIEFD